MGGLDHGQQGLTVAVDVEAVQVHIARLVCVGIVAQRKVTTVHVHTAKGVAEAEGRVEVGLQHLRLACGAQLLPRHGGGLGERATKTFQGLEGFGRVEVEAGGRRFSACCQRMQSAGCEVIHPPQRSQVLPQHGRFSSPSYFDQ